VLFDEYRGAQLGQGRRSLAYRLRLDDPARQLTDADAQQVIDAVAASVAEQVQGTLRR
jgi:phenylalanyl-tRNA synthetase beta chain